MKNLLPLLIFFGFGLSISGQTLTPELICALPAELNETSGLEQVGLNRFLTHNDSGNEPLLYYFDSSGAVKRRIRIGNGLNIDWEDITKDNKSNIYVGDFGNNNNDRNNLKIYIVADPNLLTKDTAIASIISFTYPDQKAFPPGDSLKNFDMEAFFWFNDSLYLFSKNRSNPCSGYTKCYQLPAKSGTYSAKLIDSFFTGIGSYLNYSVTSAAINFTGNKVVLLGYDRCWILSDFPGKKFFKGKVSMYPFNSMTQKEAVFFVNDFQLMITQETSVLGNAGMYRVYLPNSATNILNYEERMEFEVFPNPSKDSFQVLLGSNTKMKSIELILYDIHGTLVKALILHTGKVNTVDWGGLLPGTYVLKMSNGSFRKLVKL